MKKVFVQLFRALLCASCITALNAASDGVVIQGVHFSSTSYTTMTGLSFSQDTTGVLDEALLFSSSQKMVVYGAFSQVKATLLFSGVNYIDLYVGGVYQASAPVNNLSASGTAAANIFLLEWNPSNTTFTFRTMDGGLPGVVSDVDVWEVNDKILFVGDFGTAYTSYADFRIWDISNVAWDTYTMRLAGYDGYKPSAITKEPSDTFRVTIPTAYGGYTDDDGWEAFPWTTTSVDWDISLQRWVDNN